jgi:hypothetical protein
MRLALALLGLTWPADPSGHFGELTLTATVATQQTLAWVQQSGMVTAWVDGEYAGRWRLLRGGRPTITVDEGIAEMRDGERLRLARR